ncbi:putative bifunctional diguanylate cyclase/phosphodiesterase [Teredinibacter franksiae]|uniref:putative bifunctional diguanylate cyclase/phosphodiesterase n=1 Tax=Teredinibacter franksiae TaxID=2761453 RepID=UPI001FE3D5A7|nr:EAL domain-containing protein [Teredinibacter franksiae]
MPGMTYYALLASDATLVVVTFLLLALLARRRMDLRSRGYVRSVALISTGVSIVAIGALFHLYKTIVVAPTSLSPGAGNSHYVVLLASIAAGALLLFLGLEALINRVIPKSSQKLTELREIREQLSTSNNELAELIASRTQELEINTETLRQILEDQQLSRRALLQSEAKFHTLFDRSPALFVTVDSLHVISDINLYGAKALGYDVKSLVGEPFSKIVSMEDADKQQEFIDYCFTSTENKLETDLRMVRDNTEKLWVKITASIVRDENEPDRLLIVCQDITESKKLAESLSYQARHDDLTGLFNRRALESFVDKAVAKNTSDQTLALIYMDIDQLKIVNDTCGHSAGDELIRQLVQKINEHSKAFDFFARTGGDEFALVQLNTDIHNAVEVAEIVRNTIEDHVFKWKELTFRQSVSIGVALTSHDIRNMGELFVAVDAACFTAKQAGRNRVVVHEETSGVLNENRNEMLWVSRLQSALMQDRFELYFQPILALNDIHSGYIHYEVLLRYVDDDGTHISPDNFLPAAERFGITNQIDLWVLTTTLDYLHKNPSHAQALSCCSINLSSHSLSSHQSRMAIKQLVMTAEFDLNKICFEITETSAIHNMEEVEQFIRELKTLGCRFALDDFGTGFSSFGYLKRLEVDYIKIDGSFIQDITNDKLGRAMVKAMNAISKELGITTIAEYVENLEIRRELQELGIDYGQGFGLAKPKPIDKAKEFYALTQRQS